MTGASSGPLEGEPASGSVFMLAGSKRSLNARSISLSDAPSRTACAMNFAAGTHVRAGPLLLHALRDRDGDVRARGEQSVTSELNSRRSRGVIALVSMPGSVTSFTSAVAEPAPWARPGSRWSRGSPTIRRRRHRGPRLASWKGIRKADDV